MRGSGCSRPHRLIGVAALAAVVLLAACTRLPSEERPTTGPSPVGTSSLRIAIPAAAGTLDPRELDSPESVLLASQIFDGLVAYEPGSGAVVPAVAERWDVLDGASRFVFHLREGVRFHDGTPVTAQSFVDAWTRLADPGTPSPYAFLLESVRGFREFHTTLEATGLSGVVALDERTFEVTLVRSWPDFVAVLGHPSLSPVPPSAAEPGFPVLPTGNGPYRLTEELQPGRPVTMTSFADHVGARASVAELVWSVETAPEASWPRFLRGDLDVAPIPGSLIEDARSEFGDAGIQTVGRMLYCGFNHRLPRLANPALHRAVSLALDREALAREVYGETAVPATGLVPPAIPGSSEGACGAACRRNLEQAKRLVGSVPPKARSFALDYSDSAVGTRLAEAITADLAEAGITVRPRPHPEEELTALLREGGQEAYCLVWVADYPRQQAFLEPLLDGASADNLAAFDDPGVNQALERARISGDPTEREQRYREVEELSLELMPVVPLVWFRSHLAAKPYVTGFALDPLGRFDAASLSIAG